MSSLSPDRIVCQRQKVNKQKGYSQSKVTLFSYLCVLI